MRLFYDDRNIVRCATASGLESRDGMKFVDVPDVENAVGKRIVFSRERMDGMRVAVVCNWGDACGIATYSKYLIDALRPRVGELRIFSERRDQTDDEEIQCWTRGGSTSTLVNELVKYQPDVVLIQHEFGIFPKATHWLKVLEALDVHGIPYAVTLHSVYEHLDKTVCTAAIKNVIVHTEQGKQCLRRLGHTQNIEVIPHGCIQYPHTPELWNITKTPYAIIQFGFGFDYKGVENALRAIALLKDQQPEKYADIHYLYLCSESPHVASTIQNYYYTLIRQAEEFGVSDNVVILRGFQDEKILNNYLRTYKLAIFPYATNPMNRVHGASGAVRIAMANEIPIIVSRSLMFDDMEGVLPRVATPEELSQKIDQMFSDSVYRASVIDAAKSYVERNSWERVAGRYHDVLAGCVDVSLENAIVVLEKNHGNS